MNVMKSKVVFRLPPWSAKYMTVSAISSHPIRDVVSYNAHSTEVVFLSSVVVVRPECRTQPEDLVDKLQGCYPSCDA